MPITSFTVSKKGCLMPLISATMVWGGIVEPENFTNTISFTKLAKMLNLKGNKNNTICKSYLKQKSLGQLKLVEDYQIVFLNKKTKKFIFLVILIFDH